MQYLHMFAVVLRFNVRDKRKIKKFRLHQGVELQNCIYFLFSFYPNSCLLNGMLVKIQTFTAFPCFILISVIKNVIKNA